MPYPHKPSCCLYSQSFNPLSLHLSPTGHHPVHALVLRARTGNKEQRRLPVDLYCGPGQGLNQLRSATKIYNEWVSILFLAPSWPPCPLLSKSYFSLTHIFNSTITVFLGVLTKPHLLLPRRLLTRYDLKPSTAKLPTDKVHDTLTIPYVPYNERPLGYKPMNKPSNSYSCL